jgi:hypothetical protein
MKLKRLFLTAFNAIKQEKQAETLEKTKKILSASDIDTKLIEQFIHSCPIDKDITIFFADGSRMLISSRPETSYGLPRDATW